MKRRVTWTLGIWVLAGTVAAQELPRPAAEPNLESVKEKASYGFGYQIGRQLKSQGLDLTLRTLARGIQDGIAGQKPALPDQELIGAMQEYQRTMMTRVAMKNKEEGETFLKENREKEGVVTLESGLQYEVLQQGDGPSPRATDQVRTHYHGTLIDGSVFDSSVSTKSYQAGRKPCSG
jgi:FKBP-type peptidyl-prolyl cis-trans isomerase FklB